MLSRAQALKLVDVHLAGSAVADHSIFVGDLMALLADLVRQDALLWQVTGYCHDLDILVTADTPSLHGPTAAQWLQGRLPPDALAAIAAHDHRSGIVAETALADGLKLADALAVFDLGVSRGVALQLRSSSAKVLVDRYLPPKPWLGTMIDGLSQSLGLSRLNLADCLDRLPRQR